MSVATGGTQYKESLKALAVATHCDIVGVIPSKLGSEAPEVIDTPAINSSEAWLLLRYDLSSHSVSGQAYRSYAREVPHNTCAPPVILQPPPGVQGYSPST